MMFVWLGQRIETYAGEWQVQCSLIVFARKKGLRLREDYRDAVGEMSDSLECEKNE